MAPSFIAGRRPLNRASHLRMHRMVARKNDPVPKKMAQRLSSDDHADCQWCYIKGTISQNTMRTTAFVYPLAYWNSSLLSCFSWGAHSWCLFQRQCSVALASISGDNTILYVCFPCRPHKFRGRGCSNTRTCTKCAGVGSKTDHSDLWGNMLHSACCMHDVHRCTYAIG